MQFEKALQCLKQATLRQYTSEVERIAEEFEDSLLGVPEIPSDHMRFVLALLSDGDFVCRRGSDSVIRKLYVDRHKMSRQQLVLLLDAIHDGYHMAVDEEYALMVGDFAARTLDAAEALSWLASLLSRSATKEAVGGVLLGLDVLRMQARESGLSKEQIAEVIDRALDRRSRYIEESRRR